MSKARLYGINTAYIPNSKADMRCRKNIYQRGWEVAERDPRDIGTNRKERRRLAREKAAGAKS